MRSINTLAIALLITINSWSQAPEKMSYQAVIRNSSNMLVTSTPVGMQISILQGSSSGTVVYAETQTQSTNANGLVSLEIGNGTVVTGTFTAINWAAGPYFIKTETDPTGGTAYTISGTSELLSVPYALHAKTAESITGGITETDPVFLGSPANSITSASITSWNNKLDTEIDGSVTNEIQALRISSDTIYLSNGGYIKLPAGFDGNYNSLTNKPTNVSTFMNDAGYLTSFNEVDGSVTNEIQTLRISNDTIYLSNGGFVKIPSANAWGLNGNSGTVDGTNFMGTTDNVPLNFKVNNQKAGKIDFNLQNTALGYHSFTTATADAHNSAFGAFSLENSNGAYNTAIGAYAYKNHNIGNYNTIIGSQAGENNINGSRNVFIGYTAGYNETGSNKLYISNDFTKPPLIYGDFATGNVGIGNNNPSARLHIGNGTRFAASSDASIFLQSGNGAGSARDWKIYVPMTNGYLGFRDMGFDNLNNGMTADAMVIQSGTGNVGIGTTNPAAKLQVNGTEIIDYTTGISRLTMGSTSGATPFITFGGTAGGIIETAQNTLSLRLGSGASASSVDFEPGKVTFRTAGFAGYERLTINSVGNVGIGTTNPTSKLEVNGAIKVTGGTASQFLKADGSLDANTYLTAIVEVADEFSATSTQTSFTLTQTPSTNSKVKMYVNGIRISNTAYSVTGTTLTYVPANNGSYVLSASDRIQFDYSY